MEIGYNEYMSYLVDLGSKNLDNSSIRQRLITFKLANRGNLDWNTLQHLERKIESLGYSVSAEHETQSAGKFTKNVSRSCVPYWSANA